MDLAKIRTMALARIADRTWRHTISLDPKLADAATEAERRADHADSALEEYRALPPEAKVGNTRGSGDVRLKELEKAARAARDAATAAKAAADETSVYLEFRILTPDAYTAKLLQHSDATGQFEIEPFSLDVLDSTYLGTFTGAGGEGVAGEDLGITWAQARGGETGAAMVTHGELQQLELRAVDENRRIDSFPS